MKSYTYSFAAILILTLAVLGAGCGSSTAPVNPPTGTRTTPTPAPTAPVAQPTQPSQPTRQPTSEAPTPLPAGVPSDIPTAPNSTIINVANDAARKIVTVTMSSPDRSDRVFASLSSQLTRNGFSVTSDNTLGDTRDVIFKKGTLVMGISLIQEVDVTNYQVSREE